MVSPSSFVGKDVGEDIQAGGHGAAFGFHVGQERLVLGFKTGDRADAICQQHNVRQALVAEILHELMQRFERHNSQQNRPPVLLAMGSAYTENMQTSIANAIVEADRAMLRNKLTTRAETRQRVRDWIENHTFAKVSMNDCRYL